MTNLSAEHMSADIDHTTMQREIAVALAGYARIDLTIPAQRLVANGIREKFGCPILPKSKVVCPVKTPYVRVKEVAMEAIYRYCPTPLNPQIVKAFTEFALGIPRLGSADAPVMSHDLLETAANLASGRDPGVSERLLAYEPLVTLIETKHNLIPFENQGE